MPRYLAPFLKKDYKMLKSGKVVPLKKFSYKAGDETKEIPADDLWILANCKRGNSEMIVRCTPVLKHIGCMNVANEMQIDLSKIKTKWIKIPIKGENHAIVEISYEDGCMPIIGEANDASLQPSMKCYCATMALKRGIDRFILSHSGLYQQGIYSDTELGGEFGRDADNGVSANNNVSANAKTTKKTETTADIIADIKHLKKIMKLSTNDIQILMANAVGVPVETIGNAVLKKADYIKVRKVLHQKIKDSKNNGETN